MREFCGQRLSRRTELNKAKQDILEPVETMTHGSYFTSQLGQLRAITLVT